MSQSYPHKKVRLLHIIWQHKYHNIFPSLNTFPLQCSLISYQLYCCLQQKLVHTSSYIFIMLITSRYLQQKSRSYSPNTSTLNKLNGYCTFSCGDGGKQCILVDQDSALKTIGHQQAMSNSPTSAGLGINI